MITLDALNQASEAEFVAALDGVFEHAPSIAALTSRRRPFATVAALHEALMQTVRGTPDAAVRAFLGGHPELSADKLPAGLTAESQTEQGGLGMGTAAGAAELPALNQAYRERYGIPFIICVARHTAEDVLRCLRNRLERDAADPVAAALQEVGHITRLRLLLRVEGPGAPPVAGRLSCHVLDQTGGRPAAEIAVTLLQEGRTVVEAQTDRDGRIGSLLPSGPLRQGRYELQFAAGAYFAASGTVSFYDVIPVRFVIAAAEAHYHIPLLLAPFGYSTYRGS